MGRQTSETENIDLDALRAGNKEVFVTLIRRYHPTLVAIVRPLVGEAQAEEVVQETWIKAHKACTEFEGRAHIKTWLCSIAINEARMLLRSQKRETELRLFNSDTTDYLADRFKPNGHWNGAPSRWSSDSPDELLMQANLLDCLEKTLGALPLNQQTLLRLRDIEGEPFEMICNELEISASNARVLLHRARSFLYKMLEGYQETGEC